MKETLRKIRLPALALVGVMMFVGAPSAEAKHHHHHRYIYDYPAFKNYYGHGGFYGGGGFHVQR